MNKRTPKNRIDHFLIALAVIFMAALPLQAGGPLANCASGQPYLWPSGGVNIPFNPDQGDLGPVNNAAAVALVQAAFDEWGNVPTSTASYVNAGFLPVDVDITNFNPYLNPVAPDGLSAIVFDDTGQIFDLLFGPGSGVLGFAGPEWVNTVTCQILEGVSFLNGPSFTNATAANDVMVHEFGHYSNLAHTVVNGQIFLAGDSSGPSPNNTFGSPAVITVLETMYPFYFGPGSGFGTLEADDRAMLSTLYPAPGFFAGSGSIRGTIFAPNGTTKLTGVNVIARNVANPFVDAVSAISSDFTDSTSQADPFVGVYRINGLTPGASYAVFVDQILAGGFSTPPLSPLPGPEEFYSGASESNNPGTDPPGTFAPVTVSAGNTNMGVNVIFNSFGPGDPLPVGDDGNVQIFLPFSYELCGQRFDSVFINANGNLTFGAPSSDFSESAAEMLSGPPRVAGLWDDLNPGAGGTVSFGQSANDFTVFYNSVPEFFSTGSNTFSIKLKRSSNHIDISYGDLTAIDGLAGVSCGSAITSGFETASDLSAFAPSRINLHNQPAIYELFSGANPNDSANTTIRFNGTTNYEDNWAEPNNTADKARNITLPFDSIPITRYTEIEPLGDVDFFRFAGQAGTTLVAEILSSQLDTYMGLFQYVGGVPTLIAVDDDGGAGLLSRIVFPLPADGDYAIAVTTFPDFGFTGAGFSGNARYVLDAFAINGVLLNLGDDTFQEVSLGFTFPYQGNNYTSVFVNSNGNLTFGSGDTDFSESVSEFLNDQPRIAMLWDDLSPNQGGQVIAEFGAGTATISFMGVPEFFASTGNTFSATLSSSGDVAIDYGDVAALDGIVGVTQGGGAANPGETNFSAGGSFSATGTTYEQFTGGGDPFDLDFMSLLFTP